MSENVRNQNPVEDECPLCERKLMSPGVRLTVFSMRPEEKVMEFCADGGGCRRTAYEHLAQVEDVLGRAVRGWAAITSQIKEKNEPVHETEAT
jgi:hypothetical protein